MTTAIYVAVVEGSEAAGYSAFFPDLPGCVTAAETMLELPAAAREALSLHLAGMTEDGQAHPQPTAIERVMSDPDVQEAGRILVDVEIEDAPVRVNISIGGQFLRRVDVAAEARGMSRSGFLIEGARLLMSEARSSPFELTTRPTPGLIASFEQAVASGSVVRGTLLRPGVTFAGGGIAETVKIPVQGPRGGKFAEHRVKPKG